MTIDNINLKKRQEFTFARIERERERNMKITTPHEHIHPECVLWFEREVLL